MTPAVGQADEGMAEGGEEVEEIALGEDDVRSVVSTVVDDGRFRQ